MNPEALKILAMSMYFRLDENKAISRRWKKHHTFASIECVAMDAILKSIDTIEVLEKMS